MKVMQLHKISLYFVILTFIHCQSDILDDNAILEDFQYDKISDAAVNNIGKFGDTALDNFQSTFNDFNGTWTDLSGNANEKANKTVDDVNKWFKDK